MEKVIDWLFFSEPFSFFAGTGATFIFCCAALAAAIVMISVKSFRKFFF